jgi:integrase
MIKRSLLDKALKNISSEFPTPRLQRLGRVLLCTYFTKSRGSKIHKALDESNVLPDSDYKTALIQSHGICENKISQFPLLSLLSLEANLHAEAEQIIVHKLKVSIFYGSVSDKSVFNFITLSEAAKEIRLILSSTAYVSKIKLIPKQLTTIEILDYLCNEIIGQYTVSNAYLRMVRNGWNFCADYNEEQSFQNITKIRKRRPDFGVSALVNSMPFPFVGNDLDVEDVPEVDTIELEPDAISPTVRAEREIFRNQVLTTKEQFGLSFVSYRLSPLELKKMVQWINTAKPSASSVLAFITMLTSLKLHEVLGLHIARSEGDYDAFNRLDACYGIIDLESGVYWRKELDISDSYQPSEADIKWLMHHSSWLKLPIPKPFLSLLRAFFSGDQAGVIEQIIPNDIVLNASRHLTQACREIVQSFDFNRSFTHKMFRYLLYGCVASKYGRHKAALIFGNNEFGLSTWHYYMADTACNSQVAFMDTCIDELGLDFEYGFSCSETMLTIGSKLVITKEVFTGRLEERISLLNESLRKVKNCRSLETLRETYNQLVSYTVLMFSVVTSHRRNKSMFVEHYCWNDDYTSVLVADKIHFGESATRIIPVPELMTRQIQNTLGWLEQIIKRVRLLDKKAAVKLKASIHRDSYASFLGLWQDDGVFDTPSTAQIEVFMGQDWSLPQNAMRHLSYHTLLSYEEMAPFLDHQMGHISANMHSFQNTSLMQHDCPEVEEHRNAISRCLDELGFSLLARTSFSNSKMCSKGQFLPKSVSKKTHAKSKAITKEMQSALKSVLDKSITTNRDFYEVLAEFYREHPYFHEQALTLVNNAKMKADIQEIISNDDLNVALSRYFKKPPVAQAVLPYDVMLSERHYSKIQAAFYDFAEVLLGFHKKVSVKTLSNILLFSMILDGTGVLSPLNLYKTMAISSVKYRNGYLTADIESKGLVIFGGLSALFLAMLVKKADKQCILLYPKGLEDLMNGRCSEIEVDKSVDVIFNKFTSLLRQLHNKKMTFSKLFQLIDHAPRLSETGCLYGLRQGTLKVKGLTEHTLLRMLNRQHRYIIPSSKVSHMSLVPERTFLKKVVRTNEYYKKFMSEFRQKFEHYPGTSKEKVKSFWQELISSDDSKSLSDLVKNSQELPEIVVLILTWLYSASGRKGQRYGGLAPSSITTYFSKVVPGLCEFAANKSFTTFDYEDFLEVYQNIIDAGEVVNRAERAKIIADFHSQIQKYFGIVQVDFHDLDVDANEDNKTGRLIMPWEYDQALSILLTDKDLTIEERYTNAAILILCCRMGLRREEVRRLKLRDFSVQDQVLYVRTNRISSETVRVKSKSGNRRIPYFLYLSQTEQLILESHIDKAEQQVSRSIPLFFDSMNPSELRHMDSQFSRVIECLKLVTGDPDMRLHDGRHTCISFASSALILNDKQCDPIAKVVKEWIRSDSFSEYQQRFTEVAIATPTTRHALLPALALMVGHSSATTTLSSYTHLMDYWKWLSIENDFKKIKKLDSTLSKLIRVNRKRFTEMKSEQGLSASYVVLKQTQKKSPLEGGTYQIESFDQKPVLSARDKNSISTHVIQIQKMERALRYLEDVDRQAREAPDLNPVQPSELQYGLTHQYVSKIRQAYQSVLVNEVSYRAYQIPSNEEGVDFIGQSRLYEARNYFKDPVFYQLLIHLIQCKQKSQNAFTALMQAWEQSWYDSMKKIFIPTFQMNEANAAFKGCQLSIEFATNKINRRVGGAVFKSCAIEQLKMLGETVSIHQFSHAMFLLKLLEKH